MATHNNTVVESTRDTAMLANKCVHGEMATACAHDDDRRDSNASQRSSKTAAGAHVSFVGGEANVNKSKISRKPTPYRQKDNTAM
jgi:hypothetical protein